MNLDHSILTAIVLVPLLGAALLALLPDKGKTMQLGALIITLITFLLTLHLPYWYPKPCGFRDQFRFVEDHAVDRIPGHSLYLTSVSTRLGMWLVVLTRTARAARRAGFLAQAIERAQEDVSIRSFCCSRLR